MLLVSVLFYMGTERIIRKHVIVGRLNVKHERPSKERHNGAAREDSTVLYVVVRDGLRRKSVRQAKAAIISCWYLVSQSCMRAHVS